MDVHEKFGAKNKGYKAKRVTRLVDGRLAVETYSGKRYLIDKHDELFQVFVVFTMLAK